MYSCSFYHGLSSAYQHRLGVGLGKLDTIEKDSKKANFSARFSPIVGRERHSENKVSSQGHPRSALEHGLLDLKVCAPTMHEDTMPPLNNCTSHFCIISNTTCSVQSANYLTKFKGYSTTGSTPSNLCRFTLRSLL